MLTYKHANQQQHKMSQTKQQSYRAIVAQFIQTYGSEFIDNRKNPVVFNITGPYRNRIHEQSTRDLLVFVTVFAIITWFISIYVAFGAIVSIMVKNYWMSGQLLNEDMPDVFDGVIIDVDGRQIGVAIPTQKQEGEYESQNFRVTRDRDRLIKGLNDAKIVYNENEVATWSTGSSSSQCIDGQEVAPFCEFDMGIENWSDKQITAFLNAHVKTLTYDGVLVIMNSAGYAIRVDKGMVYNDNKLEHDTITANIVDREVGGTGKNTSAQNFVRRVVQLHKSLGVNYVLVFVPRGDKAMPQGGSHSKQRVLTSFQEGQEITLIEVSGKQSKAFELSKGACAPTDNEEHICKNIKETKITDSNGKSHGSGVVFEHI
jgi:hypothetical protein